MIFSSAAAAIPPRCHPLRIFIGYDAREPVAFHVLSHSILSRATCPVLISPLVKGHLAGAYYWRERGPTESTDFALTRFLVPKLCAYEGHAVFMDCDMLVRCDVSQLWNELYNQPDKALLCVQHDYTPRPGTKFLGQKQTAYPRKNWSSFMVFDNARCAALTPAYVNRASGLDLHRFNWLPDDQIGALSPDWNWLVEEYDPNPRAKVLHYTRGGPWFAEYADCDHADDWFKERAAMQTAIEAVA